MLDFLSAFKWYPVFLVGTALIAQAQAIDYKDLISGAPAAGAVILVVFAMLRRIDPLTRAINRNTSVTMHLCNLVSGQEKYSAKQIARMEVSAKPQPDD